MKQRAPVLYLIISGAIIFNIIFWKEKLGMNTILFGIFTCISICLLFPYSLKNFLARWLLAAHFIAALMILVNNTLLSKIGFSVTLLLFISFSQYLHRSPWYAGGSALVNYFCAIPNLFRELKSLNTKPFHVPRWVQALRLLVIPFSILIVFTFIYSSANNSFSNMIEDAIVVTRNWISHIFDWFAPERIGFFFLGTVVVAGLILRSKGSFFSDRDMRMPNDLSGKKNSLKKWRESSWSEVMRIIAGKASSGIMALKTEFVIGTISLLLLNLLLLFINIIDIKYVWLGLGFDDDLSMAGWVHEGAGMLIFSIVLAMLVLLFFFRGNLNFYKKNRWLRYGAYLWILQNAFLVLSVFNRDYYYISHYGLAYKRIGLIFFLLMVLAGLATVFVKIYFTKTTYYLLKINAWIAILLLVFASVVNWDETIAKYNIAKKSTIPVDVSFLLSLSDTTLPLLQKHKDILENDIVTGNKYLLNGAYKNAVDFFESRKKEFLEKQANYTWLSWNLADAHVKKELLNPHLSLLK